MRGNVCSKGTDLTRALPVAGTTPVAVDGLVQDGVDGVGVEGVDIPGVEARTTLKCHRYSGVKF